MNYLLDTNVCIALLNEQDEEVRKKFEQAIQSGHTIHVSAIVLFELWYGVGKGSRTERNRNMLLKFLSPSLSAVSFDAEDAEIAGMQRAALEKVGRPIGPYDLLIAGQALRRNWTLVTANVSEFSRIKGLTWEDWSRG
ncbi:MAG TPA: type II toxin-antitoxin system VapC family toxin [Terriglobales bacterium]|nr:type II toxin-antitoxin system VapC family toxin [Terriglobales bacterium]